MSLVKTLALLKLTARLNEVLREGSEDPLFVSERDLGLFFTPLCGSTPGFFQGTPVKVIPWIPSGTFTYGSTNYRIPMDILEVVTEELAQEPFPVSTTEDLTVSAVHEPDHGQSHGVDLEDEVIPFPEEAPKPKPYDGPIIEERIAFEDIPVVPTSPTPGPDAINQAMARAFTMPNSVYEDGPDEDNFMEELEASRTMEPDKFEAFMEEKFPLRPRDKTYEYDEIIEDMAEAMEGTEYVEDKDLQVPTLFGQSPEPTWEDVTEMEAELLDLKSLITPVVVDVAPEDPQGYVPSFNHVAQYVNAPDDMEEIEDCCGSCARSGTRVVLLDGTTKDVEDLEPGDEVASYYSGEGDEEDPTWISHLRDQADINEWIIGNVIPEGIEIKTADDLTILDCFRVTAAFALKRV